MIRTCARVLLAIGVLLVGIGSVPMVSADSPLDRLSDMRRDLFHDKVAIEDFDAWWRDDPLSRAENNFQRRKLRHERVRYRRFHGAYTGPERRARAYVRSLYEEDFLPEARGAFSFDDFSDDGLALYAKLVMKRYSMKGSPWEGFDLALDYACCRLDFRYPSALWHYRSLPAGRARSDFRGIIRRFLTIDFVEPDAAEVPEPYRVFFEDER